MKRIRKQIGSLLLSVCMVFTMLPTAAFAKEVETGTALDELNLPSALTVTAATGSAMTATVSGGYVIGDTFVQDGLIYEVLTQPGSDNAGTVKVIGYLGNSNIPGEVTPATVTDAVYKVVEIGDHAFESTSITSVTIPDTIMSIGDYAFYNCNALESVFISDSVKSIGEQAFGRTPTSDYSYNITFTSMTPPSFKSNSFGGSNATINAFVPTYGKSFYNFAFHNVIEPTYNIIEIPFTSDDLYYQLQDGSSGTIYITQDIILDIPNMSGGAVLYADQVLNIPEGKTVTIAEGSFININGHTLTITGGGTLFASNTGEASYTTTMSGTLNLDNITVKELGVLSKSLVQTEQINVNNNAVIESNSINEEPSILLLHDDVLNINTGGAVKLNSFYSKIYICDGGTIHLNGGTLTAVAGAKITLNPNSKVQGAMGIFNDVGYTLNTNDEVTVIGATAAASADGLTAGEYICNAANIQFVKNAVKITKQPENVSVVQGAITQALSVEATTTNSEPISYQWYSNPINLFYVVGDPISGETNASFQIPKDLTQGEYFYYCVLTAPGYNPGWSDIVTVTVNEDLSSVTVATAEQLKTEMEKTTAKTINVAADIEFDQLITMGADHTLNILNGKTVTARGANGCINIGSNLTITGGGTFICNRTNGNALYGAGTLNLENIIVNVTGRINGIWVKKVNVNNAATITVNSDTESPSIRLSSGYTLNIRTGGIVNLQKSGDIGIYNEGGTVNVDGGTLNIGKNSISGSCSINQGGILQVSNSGTLNATKDSTIYLNSDSKVEGVSGKFSDQGHILANNGSVTIGARDDIPTENGLTEGSYFYNGSVFEKNILTIISQPQNVIVTQGAITGSVSVKARSSIGQDISYRWFNVIPERPLENYFDSVTSDTLMLPANLPVGTYSCYCVLTVGRYDNVVTNTVTITVNPVDGGSSSSGSSVATTTTATENKPNQPVTVEAPITAITGINGSASASIPDKSISDAITKAQADAKAQGKTTNGVSVALDVTMPEGATTLTATLSRNALNHLVSAGVTNLEINGSPVTVSFDQKALTEIQKQSSGNVSISIAPQTNLSKGAKKLIGSRPLYNITVGYGDNSTVSSFGDGVTTVGIPYTPENGEAISGLYAVYVNEKGKATRVAGSSYDANSGCIIFTVPHFSMYGVGYIAPSAKFTDISSHWAKKRIDYVVGRGLLSGTTKTMFDPDAAMTRGMLVTALGRLVGVDVSSYTTSSFTDVKVGSTFQPYIEWAYKNDIIQGIRHKQFVPDKEITREEIAVIIANFAKATGYTLPAVRESTTYADASSIGSAYKTAVTAMQQAGIMTGGKNNKFKPKTNATRAAVSSMIYRYIKLTINPDTAQGWALNDAGQYLYYQKGKMLTDTQTIDGVKYFFHSNGVLQTGWVKDGNNWRYYSGNKAFVGWYDIGENGSNKTYYFNKDGIMKSMKTA
ncbi:MAG: S-layer homology domain-containing protein [Velocimicrobium sp.]